jgi:ATP-dependent Clp protease protease subunit
MLLNAKIDPSIKIRKIEELISIPKKITVNNFNEKAAFDFQKEFEEANATEQEIIPIIIDSYGGTCYALLSMIDTLKSSKKKIATIVIGKAMSCGSFLLACGDEGLRFAAPNSTIMVHDVSTSMVGKTEEIKSGAVEAERLSNLLFSMMAKNCAKDDKYFFNLLDEHKHADIYLTPEQAKKHNIINHIRVPEFSVEIQSKIKFF